MHNDCLVQWLRAKPSSELKCSICRAHYNVRKEKMTYADMRKLAFTVLSLAVMLTGTACMAWVKLKRFAWLADSNLLEGNNPWHCLAAVVCGIFNLRRVYSHAVTAAGSLQGHGAVHWRGGSTRKGMSRHRPRLRVQTPARARAGNGCRAP